MTGLADTNPVRTKSFWAVWSVTAAFATYFCMYGFRKPFTAASYAETSVGGVDFKTVVVSTQVLGYMLSKFLGIKVVSELPPQRRASAILILIAIAEFALLLFGVTPRPWNAGWLFLNGLALGMVFGAVLGFLEGRQLTEALVAGLCASFILADGVTKSVGTFLLDRGVTEDWMPFTAGLVFLLPLLLGVWMLTRIPPPSPIDIAQRSERVAMTAAERRGLFRRHAVGLCLILSVYLMVTIVRSIRADFAPELWRLLGTDPDPGLFTRSETLVALGVLVIAASTAFLKDNRLAFSVSLMICLAGFVLIGIVLVIHSRGQLSPFAFMVMTGFGLYLPYVAIHTTVFERLIAATGERGNLGFLMYLADAFGYLAYVVIMLTRKLLPAPQNHLQFFTTLSIAVAIVSIAALLGTFSNFTLRSKTS